jgi:hypothetical protein
MSPPRRAPVLQRLDPDPINGEADSINDETGPSQDEQHRAGRPPEAGSMPARFLAGSPGGDGGPTS